MSNRASRRPAAVSSSRIANDPSRESSGTTRSTASATRAGAACGPRSTQSGIPIKSGRSASAVRAARAARSVAVPSDGIVASTDPSARKQTSAPKGRVASASPLFSSALNTGVKHAAPAAASTAHPIRRSDALIAERAAPSPAAGGVVRARRPP